MIKADQRISIPIETAWLPGDVLRPLHDPIVHSVAFTGIGLLSLQDCRPEQLSNSRLITSTGSKMYFPYDHGDNHRRRHRRRGPLSDDSDGSVEGEIIGENAYRPASGSGFYRTEPDNVEDPFAEAWFAGHGNHPHDHGSYYHQPHYHQPYGWDDGLDSSDDSYTSDDLFGFRNYGEPQPCLLIPTASMNDLLRRIVVLKLLEIGIRISASAPQPSSWS